MGNAQINGVFFVGLIGWLGACASVTGEARPAIAFVHASVVPMNREVVLADHTVLVRGDRIVEVGPARDVAVPGDALVIQCAGKFLVPGLADMHVHLEDYEDGLVLFVANGVTTVRNMWGRPEHLDWRRLIEGGEVLGPTIHTTGPITDGEPPLWEGSAVVTTPDEGEREVLAQVEAGYDALKVMTNLRPEVFAALLRASREHDFSPRPRRRRHGSARP